MIFKMKPLERSNTPFFLLRCAFGQETKKLLFHNIKGGSYVFTTYNGTSLMVEKGTTIFET